MLGSFPFHSIGVGGRDVFQRFGPIPGLCRLSRGSPTSLRVAQIRHEKFHTTFPHPISTL